MCPVRLWVFNVQEIFMIHTCSLCLFTFPFLRCPRINLICLRILRWVRQPPFPTTSSLHLLLHRLSAPIASTPADRQNTPKSTRQLWRPLSKENPSHPTPPPPSPWERWERERERERERGWGGGGKLPMWLLRSLDFFFHLETLLFYFIFFLHCFILLLPFTAFLFSPISVWLYRRRRSKKKAAGVIPHLGKFHDSNFLQFLYNCFWTW